MQLFTYVNSAKYFDEVCLLLKLIFLLLNLVCVKDIFNYIDIQFSVLIYTTPVNQHTQLYMLTQAMS